jgi:hypothetical protein
LDPAQIRAEFAVLMDQCANAVTMEHGLDLDDVLMERFAIVGQLETGGLDALKAERREVPIPFLADQSGLIQSIQRSWATGDAHWLSPERLEIMELLEIRELLVRAYLETGVPLFNQAGNGDDPNGFDASKNGDGGR